MTDKPTAADLPDGSVVANETTAYIKTHPSKWSQWRGTDGSHCGSWYVEDVLATGGRVLRVGAGEETTP